MTEESSVVESAKGIVFSFNLETWINEKEMYAPDELISGPFERGLVSGPFSLSITGGEIRDRIPVVRIQTNLVISNEQANG